MPGVLRSKRLGLARLSAKSFVSVQYIADKLPNVPSDRRIAIADAATSATNGQGYSAESIIDALALASIFCSAEPASSFQDSAGTMSATYGQPVGRRNSWGIDTTPLTQATTAKKPTLTIDGDSFDGTDDLLTRAGLTGTEAEGWLVIKTPIDPPTIAIKTVPWSSGNIGASGHHYPFTDGIIYEGYGTTVRKTTVNPTTTLAQFNIYNVSSKANEFVNRLNNSTLFSTTTNTVGFSATLEIGGQSNINHFFDGWIKAYLHFSTVLTTENRTKVFRFLNYYYSVGVV